MAYETVMEALLSALRKAPKALAVFESLPPSHRKRWVAFVAEAEKQETRARRITKCIADLTRDGTKKKSASGYSETPLIQKLGIKNEHRVAILDAPRKFPDALSAVNATAASKVKRGAEPFDVIVLFSDRRGGLERRFVEAARALDPAGGLWVAWPKRASGVLTDITEDVVREIALAAGLVDNKVCAIDEVWSGLRCVYRKKNRPQRS